MVHNMVNGSNFILIYILSKLASFKNHHLRHLVNGGQYKITIGAEGVNYCVINKTSGYITDIGTSVPISHSKLKNMHAELHAIRRIRCNFKEVIIIIWKQRYDGSIKPMNCCCHCRNMAIRLGIPIYTFNKEYSLNNYSSFNKGKLVSAFVVNPDIPITKKKRIQAKHDKPPKKYRKFLKLHNNKYNNNKGNKKKGKKGKKGKNNNK